MATFTGLITAGARDLADQVASLQKAVNEKILPEIQSLSEKTSELADKVARIETGKPKKKEIRKPRREVEDERPEFAYEEEEWD